LINIPPSALDDKAIIESARKTGALSQREEHLVTGGLGEAVDGLLARHKSRTMRMVAMEEGSDKAEHT
jgi:transketolase C-terminal domain/subunit